ncbi:hypothetical protein BY458DRAFT_530113, partial [Sporodiniella umbellata]
DLYVWREIFHLYSEASIFADLNNKQKVYKTSQDKLQWFTSELKRMSLTKKLATRRSRAALTQFISINVQLIQFKQFQVLNQTAISKILKKHDKRSGLSATSEFLSFTKNNTLFIEEAISSLAYTFQAKIITIVPQPEDYDCPVCFTIAWRPIRLECNHVFCVRCLIKAHKKRLYDCPVCRQLYAVGNADANNLDQSLQNFMLLYFPHEIKEKRHENEKEQAALEKGNKDKKTKPKHIYRAPLPPSNMPTKDRSCEIM